MFKFLRYAAPIAALTIVGLAGCNKSEPVSEEESAALIQPVAKVELAGASAGGAAAPLRSGQQVVQQYCAACHATGAAGAPKEGDKAAWAPRIALGLDALVQSVINGKNAMPARAGASDLQDIEITRAVVFMTAEAGGNFKEPAALAAPAAAEAAPAAPIAAAADGKTTYQSACMACHAVGAAGAPKLEDKAAWAPRLAQGKETLYKSVINGKGVMPAKGGNPSLSDADLQAAVDYMLSQVK